MSPQYLLLAGVNNEELLTVPIISNSETKQHVLFVILTVQTTATLSAMVELNQPCLAATLSH